MLKKLLLFVILASPVNAQNLEDDYIESSVWFDGSLYHYEYEVEPEINGRNVTNITINLSDATLFNIYTDNQYVWNQNQGFLRILGIRPTDDEIVFGFSSYEAPAINSATIRAAGTTYTNSIYSPIPEVSSSLIGSFSFFYLLKRRR
jgi:hypothetical protein